jgi:hypothetical protein
VQGHLGIRGETRNPWVSGYLGVEGGVCGESSLCDDTTSVELIRLIGEKLPIMC